MTDQALDVKGLAHLLNVSVSTAYRLANTREVPGFKVGNRWRFWEQEVKRSLEEQDPWRRSPQSQAALAREQRKRER